MWIRGRTLLEDVRLVLHVPRKVWGVYRSMMSIRKAVGMPRMKGRIDSDPLPYSCPGGPISPPSCFASIVLGGWSQGEVYWFESM